MSEKSGANAGKDVLYIDVDDEITSIIEKVRTSKQKIVALVLPKRATVLQSIVNMKLLKRSADSSHKNLVLITSETGLLPLAGTVGLHVARSLQTKPEIPDIPGRASEADTDDAAEQPDVDDTANAASGKAAKAAETSLDKTRSIGELAGAAALDEQVDDDSIDLNDDDEDTLSDDTPLAGAKPKKGTNKKLRIPNFNKFRLLIILGGVGVVALAVLLYVALAILPKATIAIKTDSSAVDSSNVIVLKTGNNVAVDVTSSTVPATVQQVQKAATQQVGASGQKNNGDKASGTVSMSAKVCGTPTTPGDVPSGTGVTSGGLTFITQASTTFNYDHISGGCIFFKATSTPVTAQSGGAQYNIAAASFTVSGRSDVTASGSAMAGGTDNITKIVTQGDIDSAKQKLSAADTDGIKQELKSGLVSKGLLAIDTTFNPGNPDVKTSVNAGDAAESVSVTQTTTYTMLGAKQTDLQKIVQNDVKGKIDLKKQKILDYGMVRAVVGLQSQNADGATITYQTTVVVGSELNNELIKTQVAGKKAGDAKAVIKQNPGVTEVTVTYSPFWVSSIPKKTGKITVVVQKPTASSAVHNATNP